MKKIKEVLEFSKEDLSIFIEIDYSSKTIILKNQVDRREFIFLNSSTELTLKILNLLTVATKEAERRLNDNTLS